LKQIKDKLIFSAENTVNINKINDLFEKIVAFIDAK